MHPSRSRAVAHFVAAAAAVVAPETTHAEEAAFPICPLVAHEEAVELEDAQLAVELARSSVAAFDKIYGLIAGLYKAEAIDRMRYLRAKYDRDAAKLSLERADLVLARQEALIGQLTILCEETDGRAGEDRDREIGELYRLYRRADCDQQAKAIEVAEINLTFNRQWLESIIELRDHVSTAQDVIMAELDVELEEQRRDDAMRRTESCRNELARLK
jgi:hypothetical protein